ncbi:uncharacterized protein K441DRAFT_663813 [Cenococcum geophilum 1.58]|uniref:uncharacterized protein n=1 Tax=Cenococcum geophilum 1.58 TaxID=794803 RepID=UPI00358DE11B|nr:hypothetical protein K441DRAFT_663813 [Cenococcum geophilum 1.58]
MVWAAFYEWGNITAQGFLDHIYPKLKKFYDFYNAKYSVYFPNHKFGSTLTIIPDLNLIKAVWNLIKTQLAKRKPRPLTKEAI